MEERPRLFGVAGNPGPVFAQSGAPAQAANPRARRDAMVDAHERAASHAALAGLPYKFLRSRAKARLAGRTPAGEVLAWIDAQEQSGAEPMPAARAEALAMLGRFEESRAILAEAGAAQAER